MVRILSFNEQITGRESISQRDFVEDRKWPFQECKKNLIKEVLRRSFLELGISFALTGLALVFVATPAGAMTLLTCTVIALAINILLRCSSAYCKFRLFQLKYDPSKEAQVKNRKFTRILNFLQYFTATTFSALVDGNTRAPLTYHGGQALAAKCLFSQSNPNITLKPFENSQTGYQMSTLTKIGQFFGKAKATLIVVAAGPALAVVSASAFLGASLALGKRHPEKSRYLKVVAIDTIFQNAFYALSALWETSSKKSHDFVQLMAGSIHPLFSVVVSVVSIIALPLIVRLGFFLYDKINSRNTKNHKSID